MGGGRGDEGVTAKVCAVSVFIRSMSRLILFIIFIVLAILGPLFPNQD